MKKKKLNGMEIITNKKSEEKVKVKRGDETWREKFRKNY